MSLCYRPATARRRLLAKDPTLAALIRRAGPFRLEAEADFSCTPFAYLLRSIVYQQLSGKAAARIHERLCLTLGGPVVPEAVLACSDDALRRAGLSRNKVSAARDLALKTQDGTLPTRAKLLRMDDAAIIERLCQVRGIGRWTVEMLLIFHLGRADVLPVGDLGVRRGYQWAWGLEQMPTPKELAAIGEGWAPYRSMASWYLWRASDDLQWT